MTPRPISLHTSSTPIPISTIISIPSIPEGAYCQPSLMPWFTAEATSFAYSSEVGSRTRGKRRNKVVRPCTRTGGLGGVGCRDIECCTDYFPRVYQIICCHHHRRRSNLAYFKEKVVDPHAFQSSRIDLLKHYIEAFEPLIPIKGFVVIHQCQEWRQYQCHVVRNFASLLAQMLDI